MIHVMFIISKVHNMFI